MDAMKCTGKQAASGNLKGVRARDKVWYAVGLNMIKILNWLKILEFTPPCLL